MCKSCYIVAWIKEHPNSNSGTTWLKNNPERALWHQKRAALRKYGLTPSQFDEMWEIQEGKCANLRCRVAFPRANANRRIGGLHVDHDHATGKVRGLLCPRCNTALGHVSDDVPRLRGLIDYLELHSLEAAWAATTNVENVLTI